MTIPTQADVAKLADKLTSMTIRTAASRVHNGICKSAAAMLRAYAVSLAPVGDEEIDIALLEKLYEYDAGTMRGEHPSSGIFAEAIHERCGLLLRALKQREARVRELEAAQEWQPIETAPKDGTSVLISNGVSVGEAHYEEYAEGWFWAGGHSTDAVDYKVWTPTHWRPLPPPPKDKTT